jgi:hypothetical protein
VQYPSYVFAETLRDGTAVTVRAAGANDGPKIRRAFLNLERDTVYTRFFGYKADVSDAELGRITGADFERAKCATVSSRHSPWECRRQPSTPCSHSRLVETIDRARPQPTAQADPSAAARRDRHRRPMMPRSRPLRGRQG